MGEREGMRTRQANHIRVDIRRRAVRQCDLYYEGFKLYNEIPNDLKNAKNLYEFKRGAAKHATRLRSENLKM